MERKGYTAGIKPTRSCAALKEDTKCDGLGKELS